MNIKLDSNLAKVKINGTEVDKVKYNGAVVWEKPAARGIYGVSLVNQGSDYSLTRTDNSASFTDPVPYLNDGNTNGSSPFDNIMPWSGIVRETIGTNEMVKIPKFWYKIESTATQYTSITGNYITKIQIANYAETGFSVSPAHADRGEGEKDYVYVGRYLANSVGASRTGQSVNTNTRSSCRQRVTSNQGSRYHLFDYSLLVTLWLLYIVEFANTDANTKIGQGAYTGNTGATDTMPYHTGTMATTRSGNGATQYRYIECLWGKNYCWVDGINQTKAGSSSLGYFLAGQVTQDFSNYTDTFTGVSIGQIPTDNRANYMYVNPGSAPWAIRPSYGSVGASGGRTPNTVAGGQSGTSSGSLILKPCCVTGGIGSGSGLFYLSFTNTNQSFASRNQYYPSTT